MFKRELRDCLSRGFLRRISGQFVLCGSTFYLFISSRICNNIYENNSVRIKIQGGIFYEIFTFIRSSPWQTCQ